MSITVVVFIRDSTCSCLYNQFLHPMLSPRPAGPMARRLTTNQEIAGSTPASVNFLSHAWSIKSWNLHGDKFFFSSSFGPVRPETHKRIQRNSLACGCFTDVKPCTMCNMANYRIGEMLIWYGPVRTYHMVQYIARIERATVLWDTLAWSFLVKSLYFRDTLIDTL